MIKQYVFSETNDLELEEEETNGLELEEEVKDGVIWQCWWWGST